MAIFNKEAFIARKYDLLVLMSLPVARCTESYITCGVCNQDGQPTSAESGAHGPKPSAAKRRLWRKISSTLGQTTLFVGSGQGVVLD